MEGLLAAVGHGTAVLGCSIGLQTKSTTLQAFFKCSQVAAQARHALELDGRGPTPVGTKNDLMSPSAGLTSGIVINSSIPGPLGFFLNNEASSKCCEATSSYSPLP